MAKVVWVSVLPCQIIVTWDVTSADAMSVAWTTTMKDVTENVMVADIMGVADATK